ncbi:MULTISPECIES: phosphoribosylanthranilate isomerase [unclassified Flavobacterium]|uniref:phosphoribosylanthranilate isomerase n=1 Tax=unclassified Flavobacterium TaxID=196869 RepID=UPI00096319B3|nr:MULTISPECIES: phosphoribosylanthranilate isomerase [unclassified Flavobacterium]OJV68685.1 MAG: N-(5'-phosphoribosyl)anthranilate isomerase [Flavobacterium sp. 40-81]
MKNRIQVKICGMKYSENIQAIAALQPDYLGFIFYEKSARYFDAVVPEIAGTVKKTGVFVNASIAVITAKVKQYDLQAVQLHGEESADFCLALKALPGIEIIKTFSMDPSFDFKILEAYDMACDYYLFDTKGKLPGGNGFAFDWNILQQYPSSKPFFLSGGIGVADWENISLLLETGLPVYAIDLNSKLETAPGLKNETLCEEAILTINNITT